MWVLSWVFLAIFGFFFYTLLQAWSTDTVVKRAHHMLQRAKNGDPDAEGLLAACCIECEYAIKRQPRHVRALEIWGAALWSRAKRTAPNEALRLLALAEQKYVEALDLQPDDPKLSIGLFWVLWDRAHLMGGRPGLDILDRLCDECERLLILHPSDAGLLSFWGNALESLGNRAAMPEADRRYAAAEEKYSAALAIKAGDAAIQCSLASVLWRRSRRHTGDEARALLGRAWRWIEAAVTANPSDARARSLRAWLLFGRSRLEPSVDVDRLLSQAAAQFAGHGEHPQAAGLISWAQAQRAASSDATRLLEAARQKLTEAEGREPGSAAYNLACICAQLGDDDGCREWLQRSGEPGVLVSREQMGAEEELAAVRDRPWFRELLA